jgi:hypothetical protein
VQRTVSRQCGPPEVRHLPNLQAIQEKKETTSKTLTAAAGGSKQLSGTTLQRPESKIILSAIKTIINFKS